MYEFSKKFLDLEKLVNGNGGNCEISVFSHGKDISFKDTLSVSISSCAGVKVIRFCEIDDVTDAFSSAYEGAFIKAAEALYPEASSSPAEEQSNAADISPELTPQDDDSVMDDSDDFQVFFGAYKEATDGNWFSQLLVNDPVILRKLSSIPHPTSEALISYQAAAKAYLERRHITL